MPQSRFAALLSQNDLPLSFIYLAPVLPIVQIMWADGKNQIPERAKLHLAIQSHCQALSELAGDLQVISPADVELFDQTFIASEPDMETLQAFTDEATELLRKKSDSVIEENGSLYHRDRLFHACLEIAATCSTGMSNNIGEMFSQRIVEEERRFIEQVFKLLPELN